MSRIRADKFVNNAANGAPQLTFGAEVVAGVGLTGAGGINITGIATAASFSGNITGTTGTFTGNVSVGGTLTYEDVTNIDSVGIITARSDVSIADKIIHTGDTNTAIRFPAADTFTVETAGSERLRVDSSGRLLVNKTASTGNNIGGIGYANVAQIEGAAVGAGLNVSNTAETARINITWKETESSLSDGDKLGHLSFGAGVANAVERARIECNAETTDGSNKRGGQLTFMTCADGGYEPAERVRITNAGNVGINETTPQQQLHVHDDTSYNGIFINGNGAPRITFARDATTTVEWGVGVDGTDGSKFCIAQAGNTAKITLDTSGNFTAVGNVTAYSDITLKENIETIPNALDKVLNLRGVEFDRIDKEDNTHEIGVIAQEVEEVIPEVVLTNTEGIKSVAYGNLVGLLIESIKELKAEINDLKAKVEG
jgi:hypothetical protein